MNEYLTFSDFTDDQFEDLQDDYECPGGVCKLTDEELALLDSYDDVEGEF